MLNILAQIIVSSAHAQAAASTQDGPGVIMGTVVPMVAMLFIFYFLMIRPQIKNQKTKQAFLTTLKRGDEVLTSSGIFGTIEGLTEKFVTLEIADGVKIRILRDRVMAPVKEEKK